MASKNSKDVEQGKPISASSADGEQGKPASISSADVEQGTAKTVSGEMAAKAEFKVSDIQTCGKYVTYLTLVYFVMVLTQVCNLLFMTFADRKPTEKDVCKKQYPDYLATKKCNMTNCWVKTNEGGEVVCSSRTYDFIPIRHDFEVLSEYVKLGTTVQNVGLMIGAIVAGNLADIFGRKKILLSFTVGLIVFLVVTPFSSSFVVFTVLRFFDMIFTGGKHCVCNPYFMENLPDKHRMWVATVVTYSPNYIVLAGIAYLCHRWKVLSWTTAVLTVLPLIMIPFLQDTPRWLVKKGKGNEASRAAVYIRKWDEKMTPEREAQIVAAVQKAADEELQKMQKRKKNYYFYHLFTDWKLGSYAIVFATSLFSTSFISYGIAYNMDALAGTVYVNVIILGAARWAINIIAASLEYSIKKVGRRLLHLVAVGFIVVVMAILFITYIFTWQRINTYKETVKAGGTGDPSVHSIVMFTRYASLLAAAMCTELFVLDAVQPTELFPTPVRSAGIAFIQTFNRLGTILSPLVFIPSKKWPPAPFFLMFLTSAADFLLYFFFVPETRGKKLPDNMPGEEQSGSVKPTQASIATKRSDSAPTQSSATTTQASGATTQSSIASTQSNTAPSVAKPLEKSKPKESEKESKNAESEAKGDKNEEKSKKGSNDDDKEGEK